MPSARHARLCEEPGHEGWALLATVRRRRLLGRQWSAPRSGGCWPTSRRARSTRSSSTRSIADPHPRRLRQAWWRCSTARGHLRLGHAGVQHHQLMGRLTLNVLLSFAQFEREVTGERIRDKIAASKAKGLWMGGNPRSVTTRLRRATRILQVNDSEAATRSPHLRTLSRARARSDCWATGLSREHYAQTVDRFAAAARWARASSAAARCTICFAIQFIAA